MIQYLIKISEGLKQEFGKLFFLLSRRLELHGGEGGGGVLPIMAYTESLRPKGIPFSGFRYIKG